MPASQNIELTEGKEEEKAVSLSATRETGRHGASPFTGSRSSWDLRTGNSPRERFLNPALFLSAVLWGFTAVTFSRCLLLGRMMLL